jgi:hypothetical protein
VAFNSTYSNPLKSPSVIVPQMRSDLLIAVGCR